MQPQAQVKVRRKRLIEMCADSEITREQFLLRSEKADNEITNLNTAYKSKLTKAK